MRINENNEENTVDFANLSAGDCFRYYGDLCVKSEVEQEAVGLKTGKGFANMCGEQVTPVNAEIRIID